MDVMPMTGGLGAEICGVDVRDSAQFPEIYAAFAKYSVITLRKQSITPKDHLDFARRFGSCLLYTSPSPRD